jgi:cyclase
MKKMENNSDFYTLYELGEGCYAAIEIEGKRTGSNAGFVDLGDKVIVFDTFLSIDAARDLLRNVIEVTGKSPDYVINSHEHSDHYVGNQLFNAPIISTQNTKDAFVRFQQTLKEVAELPKNWVEKRVEEIENEKDEANRKSLDNELNFIYNLKDKGVKATPPTKIIDEPMKIHGDTGSATIHVVKNAHTKSDIYLMIEEQKICFCGDLLFSNCYPWLGSGDPSQLNGFMKTLVDEEIDYFVPGHGQTATKKEVYLQIKYVDEILTLARKYRDREQDISKINSSDLSPEFTGWDEMVFKWNNNFLSKYIE